MTFGSPQFKWIELFLKKVKCPKQDNQHINLTTLLGSHVNTITTRNFVFCNLSYATKKSHMQLFWSCMRHVQLHATFFSCIRQVAKDKISRSECRFFFSNFSLCTCKVCTKTQLNIFFVKVLFLF